MPGKNINFVWEGFDPAYYEEVDTKVEKAQGPCKWGILKPQIVTEKNWDNTANKLVGKVIPNKCFFKSGDDGWYAISFTGDPFDENNMLFDISEVAYIHQDNLFYIPDCVCTHNLSHAGCSCGGITAEREFAKMSKLAQK